MNETRAPFTWFGGKSKAAPLVWQLLGDVDHYVEPFAGSLAVLLDRPHPCNRTYYSETVNDVDGLLCNAWRSIQYSPDATAQAASWPVSECDKSARQIALLRWRVDSVAADLLAGDPHFHDPVMGGRWLWAVAVQIGAFAGDGAWTADPVTGRIVKMGRKSNGREPGVSRDRPQLSHDGEGVNTPAMREPGVCDEAAIYHPTTMPKLRAWFALLSARLRHVRVLHGDWTRLCTTGAMHTLTVRMKDGHVGVFLDPPYGDSRRSGLYAHDSHTLLHDVREWCVTAGADPHNRIVLAGFESEHDELAAHGWTVHEWFSEGFLRGGMGDQQHRERMWVSPHCLGLATAPQFDLFAGSGTTGEACMLAGFDCTLIEREAQHARDIEHRIKRWSGLDAQLRRDDWGLA